MNIIHAQPANVYRFPLGDCTNNGVSSIFPDLLIACPDGYVTFDADVQIPLNFCMIERRVLGGRERLSVVPATVTDSGKPVPRPGWWMNGGNIVDSSDARINQLSYGYPLRVHDRRE